MHCFAKCTKENTSRRHDAIQFGLGKPSAEKAPSFWTLPNGGRRGGRSFVFSLLRLKSYAMTQRQKKIGRVVVCYK